MRVGGGKSLNKWVNGCIYIVEEEQYVKKKKKCQNLQYLLNSR